MTEGKLSNAAGEDILFRVCSSFMLDSMLCYYDYSETAAVFPRSHWGVMQDSFGL